MNTETIRITKLTIDPWGYPVAHWTGDRGSQGETRIGERGEDPAACEGRAEAAILAELAEEDQAADGEQ